MFVKEWVILKEEIWWEVCKKKYKRNDWYFYIFSVKYCIRNLGIYAFILNFIKKWVWKKSFYPFVFVKNGSISQWRKTAKSLRAEKIFYNKIYLIGENKYFFLRKIKHITIQKSLNILSVFCLINCEMLKNNLFNLTKIYFWRIFKFKFKFLILQFLFFNSKNN